MSSGLVSMLLFLSIMQSNGGVSWFLKTFLFIFLGLFSYSCLYFVIAFLMHSCVYFVVILRACLFAFLPSSAKVLIHSCGFDSGLGGGGMIYGYGFLILLLLGGCASLVWFLLCVLLF
jgi:hypothetical protein